MNRMKGMKSKGFERKIKITLVLKERKKRGEGFRRLRGLFVNCTNNSMTVIKNSNDNNVIIVVIAIIIINSSGRIWNTRKTTTAAKVAATTIRTYSNLIKAFISRIKIQDKLCVFKKLSVTVL